MNGGAPSDILKKYPNRTPVIMHKIGEGVGSVDIGLLDKKKYLVPHAMQLGDFMAILRNRLELSASVALFVFVRGCGKAPALTETIRSLYDQYKDPEDLRLHLQYTGENAFGV